MLAGRHGHAAREHCAAAAGAELREHFLENCGSARNVGRVWMAPLQRYADLKVRVATEIQGQVKRESACSSGDHYFLS